MQLQALRIENLRLFAQVELAFTPSWNLLTGTHETVRGILNRRPNGDDDAAYRYAKPDRTVRKSQPVYMEDTPNPDELIDAEVVPEGEDRD